ncbi:MAG: menaquinone biosynthesis protein [Planctomycetota bacterium]|nr:menaquinone biosynthesis protein [Planctomycetota bacterium]
MAEKLRIGTVRFLNAWPLVFGLKDRADVELRAEVPSALGPMLARGEVDVALAPSIEYFRLASEGAERARAAGALRGAHAGFVALPVAAIGSRGAIGSVKLFGFAEQDRLRRVLLDPASRTSNALARVLVVRRLGCTPHFVMPEEIGLTPPRPPDAEVVIGDRALTAERPGAKWVHDLGAEWHRFMRLPFVYAFWMARTDAPLGRLTEMLAEARDRGLAARESIAEEAARELGLPGDVARRYLLDQVRYGFGPKEQEGLRAFYRMAAEEGLAPEGVRLNLVR